MRAMETNELLLMNSIVYEIYTMDDLDTMRLQLLEQLQQLVEFDSADFFLAGDSEEGHLARPVTFHCNPDSSTRYDPIDYSRGILYSGKCMVYRETDIMSDERRIETEYYQRVYRPNGWHYSMQIILGKEQAFLGVITLYRKTGKEDFSYDDVFLLDMLKEHLAYRLYREAQEEGVAPDKLSLNEAVEKFELTKRERTVLAMLLQGKDNENISEELAITTNTLKKHILNLYRKDKKSCTNVQNDSGENVDFVKKSFRYT